MYEQSYAFAFEAAHDLAENVRGRDGHIYSRLHGHSFRVEVTVRGESLPEEGWVMDFAVLREACEDARLALDHRFLNDIEGLERPTLETLSSWIYRRLKPAAPKLWRVEVSRPTLNERVAYTA